MAEWKGVPYFFDANGLHEQLSVAVEKMPVVLIETPLAWETIAGVGASTIIAIWALISNFKLARFQNNQAIKKENASAFLTAMASIIANANLCTQHLIRYEENRRSWNENKKASIVEEINFIVKELNHDHSIIKLLLVDNIKNNKDFLGILSTLVDDMNEFKNKIFSGSIVYQSDGDDIHAKIDSLIMSSKEFRANLLNEKK
ncbi:hypothetical protein ACURKV_003061 [Morganella morganii]